MRASHFAQMHASEQPHQSPEQVQVLRDASMRVLEEMESLFSQWRDFTSDEATRRLPPPALPISMQLSDDAIIGMRVEALQRNVGIVFTVSGQSLTVRPKSKLTESDRAFIELNTSRIIEQIQHEQDLWIL